MSTENIYKRLKEEMGVEKGVVGLQRLQEGLPDIEDYEGKNTFCFMMQEALDENKVFYTTLKNRMCLGCTSSGMAPTPYDELSEEKLKNNLKFVVEAINTYQDVETAYKAEKKASQLFAKFDTLCNAVLIGPAEMIDQPDIVVITCNPSQANILTRAYCYVTGTFIKGYAGIGVCRTIFPDAFVTGEPTFTVSDRSWRIALKMKEEDLSLVTPPDKLKIMLDNVERSTVGGPSDEAFGTMINANLR